MLKPKLLHNLIGVYALLSILILAACGGGPSVVQSVQTEPTQPAVTPVDTPDPFFASDGRGEPRSAGYWLLWNSCVPENRATQAAANGGRQAGWLIVDDLLMDPGILLGAYQMFDCQEGIRLLQGEDLDGNQREQDLVYGIAKALLVAQLNLAAGAEFCPAVDESVRAGQVLLLAVAFTGRGEYGEALAAQELDEVAEFLLEQLGRYNRGGLCR